MRGSRIRHALVAVCATAACMAVGSSTALADTTHVFERYIDIPGAEEVQPVDTDAQGNLLIWRNDTNDLIKVDPNGNPVNFSALGTNVLDGAGDFDCPKTPSDCDQMPTTNGFQNGTSSTGYIRNIVGVDHSNGPASGYIYITNNYRDLDGREQAETVVFAASGKYLGKLDETQPFPNQFYLKDWWRGGVSVGSDGAVYVVAASGLSRSTSTAMSPSTATRPTRSSPGRSAPPARTRSASPSRPPSPPGPPVPTTTTPGAKTPPMAPTSPS